MNYQARKLHERKQKSAGPRKEAVERVADTPEQISLGKFIARATGTAYAPLAQLSRNDGGGVMYAYTNREPLRQETVASVPGGYGRMPLNVKRDPASGMYDIAR